MLELAARYGDGEPVRIRVIADEHGIPARFLVQILLQLKGAGFVASTRGASGGYQLIKSPEEISLGDIVAAIEGPEAEILGPIDETPSGHVLRDAWNEIGQVERELLRSLTFDLLAERVKRQAEMYYI